MIQLSKKFTNIFFFAILGALFFFSPQSASADHQLCTAATDGIGSTTATVHWTYQGYTLGTTTPDASVLQNQYYVRIGTVSCSNAVNTPYVDTGWITSAATSRNITALSPSTHYYAAVYVDDTDGAYTDDWQCDPAGFTTSAAGGPTTPASLGQFKNDGTTAVSNGSWLKSSDTGNIKLQATTTEAVAHTLTLYFQLLQDGGTFDSGTGIPTSACAGGSAYPCSGSSPVNTWSIASSGSVTSFTNTPMQIPVADYASGYKWQVKACDGTVCSSWAAFNATHPNFKVDTTAPSGGSVSDTNGYQTTVGITANVNKGTDGTSGMSATNGDYLLEVASATLSAGSCGSFGGYADASVAETAAATSYAYTGATGNCYKFRYTVKDVAGNPVTYTGTDITKIDTAAPSGGSITYANGYQASLSVALTGTDGTDGISGINTASRQFKRRSTGFTSGGVCDTGNWSGWSSAISTGATTYTDTIAANTCYQYQYQVSDNAGNQATYTSTNTVYHTQPSVTITVPSATPQTISSDANNNFDLSYTLGYVGSVTFSSGSVVFHPASGSDTTCALTADELTASVAGTAHSRVNLSSCTGGTLTKGTVYTLTVSATDSNSATGTASISNITYGGLTPAWTQDKWNGTAQAAPQYAFSQWDQNGFTNWWNGAGNVIDHINLTGGGIFDSVSLGLQSFSTTHTSDTDWNGGDYGTPATTADNGSGSVRLTFNPTNINLLTTDDTSDITSPNVANGYGGWATNGTYGQFTSNTQQNGTVGTGASVALAYDLGGNGSDGNFNASVCSGTGMTLNSLICTIDTNNSTKHGTYNFGTITIPSTYTLKATGANALTLYATGSVTINGTINVNGGDAPGTGNCATAGIGVAGGGDGGIGLANNVSTIVSGFAGSGTGTGNGGNGAGNGYGSGGGGGGGIGGTTNGGWGSGGSGSRGGTGNGGGSGGVAYHCAGSGGGGGGILSMASNNQIIISSSGAISANGGKGGVSSDGYAGGGGGSGGIVTLKAPVIANSGTISAKGGDGNGDGSDGCGGGGGGGVISSSGRSITGNTASAAGGNSGGCGTAGQTLTPNVDSNLVYKSSGTYTSYVDAAGASPAVNYTWKTFTWGQTLGTGSSISMKVKSSNSTSTPDFSGCATINSGDTITSNSCVNSTDKYLWYQATLTAGSSNSTTPALDSVTVNVDRNFYQPSGAYTSPTINAGGYTAANLTNLGWSQTANSGSMKMQVASSNSSGGPWTYYGPQGTTGPVALYHLDGTVGSIANGAAIADATGQNNGTFSNANNSVSTTTGYATGKIGQGITFDGTDDYINAGMGSSFNVGNNLTIEAWVNPTDLTARRTIFSDRSSGSAGAFQLEVGPGSGGTNRVGVTTPGTWNVETNNNAIATGNWYHIVYTKNGTGAGSQKLYINGISQSLLTDNPQVFADNSDPKLIGATSSSSGFFQGQLDEVAVYNRVLSADEITQHYASGAPTNNLDQYYYYTNFLQDSDFETFTGTKDDASADTFTGWSGNLLTPLAVSDAKTGTTALKLKYSGSGDNYLVSDWIYPAGGGTMANKSYTLSFWAKATSNTTVSSLALQSSSGNDYLSPGNLSLTTNWQYYTYTATFASSDAALRAVLRTSGSTAIDVFYDDVQISAGTSNNLLNSIHNGSQYFRYKSILNSSPDQSTTPTLDDASLAYQKYPMSSYQVIQSSPFNTGNANNTLNRIFWSNLSAGDLKFQVRTAPDLNGAPNWASSSASGWCGTGSCSASLGDGTTGSYYSTAGTQTYSTQRDGANDQWMQYAVFEKSVNGDDTPNLDNITLEYQYNNPPVVKTTSATWSSPTVTVNYNLNSNTGEETAANVRLFYQPVGVTLSSNITNAATSIALANPNSLTLPTSGSVLLSNELVTYTGVTGNPSTTPTLTGVTRGQPFASTYTTAAATHNSGIPIFFWAPSAATNGVSVGTITALSGSPIAKTITWNTGTDSITLTGTEILKVAANDGQTANNIGSDIIGLRTNTPAFKNNVNFRNGVQIKNDQAGTCTENCDAKQADGQPCTSDSGCINGNCDIDFATSAGYCHSTSSYCADSSSSPWERAIGYKRCSGNSYYMTCNSGNIWGSQVNNPNPSNSYYDAGGGAQSGYWLANTCANGGSGGFSPTWHSCLPYMASSTSTCVSTCSANSDCWSVSGNYYYCSAGSCIADPCAGGTSISDVDGNSYNTVAIGTQCWMAENLRTTKKPDGTDITALAYCNSAGCGSPWGRLYGWTTAMNGASAATGTGAKIQGICPTGWHIPSDYAASANDDFQKLSTYLGGDSVSGGALKATGTTYWTTPNTGATNSSGFTGVGAGAYYGGSFYSRGYYGYFWSSSEYDGAYAWNRILYYDNAAVTRNVNNKTYGFSVRCIKD